jgi:hypothetical protein
MDFTPVENVPHVSVQVHSGIIGSGIRGVFDRIVVEKEKRKALAPRRLNILKMTCLRTVHYAFLERCLPSA